MTRQHSAPLLLSARGAAALPLPQVDKAAGISEAAIQRLVHEYPEILPIAEIDAAFENPVPICMELATSAGPIDNLLITASGYPVLVECKLWRNPQARREVVGQVLDYAKELARWTSSDLAREASRRGVASLFEAVGGTRDDLDEAAFHDALSRNLRRGRCLLLIVGDGIREGVEAIFQHLGEHAALQFSLGLVEMPFYAMPNGDRIVVPRVLARTAVDVRVVIEAPDGMRVENTDDNLAEVDPKRGLDEAQHREFWRRVLQGMKLDDPEQPIPSPSKTTHLFFAMPAPSGTSWITAYRSLAQSKVGVFLSYNAGTVGQRASDAVVENWDEYERQIGGRVRVIERRGRRLISDELIVDDLLSDEGSARAVAWLKERLNAFVNVLRPAIRATVDEVDQLER